MVQVEDGQAGQEVGDGVHNQDDLEYSQVQLGRVGEEAESTQEDDQGPEEGGELDGEVSEKQEVNPEIHR